MTNGHAAFKLVFKLVLFRQTLEGCYSVTNGHAAFKLVFKLVLFSKTLEGCYSVSDGHAAKLDQFACFLQLFTVTFFQIGKRYRGYGEIAASIGLLWVLVLLTLPFYYRNRRFSSSAREGAGTSLSAPVASHSTEPRPGS